MFRYDENNEIKNLKILDYQLSFWGSFAMDIYNYMMSSWKAEFKVKKFDELIKFYFDNLIVNLKLLNYQKKLPTYKDLQDELLKRKFLGNRIDF